MRYVILKSNISLKEKKARQEYLYDIFKIYFMPFCYKTHSELKSIPFNFGDTIFIYGHNEQVYRYLLNNKIKETNIVLITCYFGRLTKIRLENKNMFYTEEITDRFNGEEYGFDFEITNSEINLYNCPYSSIEDKIKYSFKRIE